MGIQNFVSHFEIFPGISSCARLSRSFSHFFVGMEHDAHLCKHLDAMAKELQCPIWCVQRIRLCLTVSHGVVWIALMTLFTFPVLTSSASKGFLFSHVPFVRSLTCNRECIGQCMKGKSQCPLCRIPVIPRSILKNSTLQNIVRAYKGIREVSNRMKGSSILPSEPQGTSDTSKENISPSFVNPSVNNKRSRSAEMNLSVEKEMVQAKRAKYQEKPQIPPPPPKLALSSCVRPIILCTSLCDEYKKRVQARCEEFGGKIVNSISPAVTHVVTRSNNRGIGNTRTLKYLQGILQGCWIVDYECKCLREA